MTSGRKSPTVVGATLRASVPSDVPRIIEMLVQEHLPPVFVEEFLSRFVTVERAGSVIGCGGIEVYGESAVIRSVAIDASARGLGLGGVLARRLISDARDGGARDIYLFTQDAREFWAHLGFIDVALEAWVQPARASWQYQFLDQNREMLGDIHSMRLER
ncbi:MAG: GNAT family N-acetyltransferase [Chloroflexi bacterium]|nr:GNAT family N-acetyltransferase [Chloroflexota bacterium]